MDGNNGLSISDFQIGDRITHDHYGLGKVIETQDKGANSVITVDFGTDGVKRLLLRVAPIGKALTAFPIGVLRGGAVVGS